MRRHQGQPPRPPRPSRPTPAPLTPVPLDRLLDPTAPSASKNIISLSEDQMKRVRVFMSQRARLLPSAPLPPVDPAREVFRHGQGRGLPSHYTEALYPEERPHEEVAEEEQRRLGLESRVREGGHLVPGGGGHETGGPYSSRTGVGGA